MTRNGLAGFVVGSDIAAPTSQLYSTENAKSALRWWVTLVGVNSARTNAGLEFDVEFSPFDPTLKELILQISAGGFRRQEEHGGYCHDYQRGGKSKRPGQGHGGHQVGNE